MGIDHLLQTDHETQPAEMKLKCKYFSQGQLASLLRELIVESIISTNKIEMENI
jgi:hypothetical protein